ncbi:MAG: Lrp/AsnC ligand binding domain-containing protein [Nitrososphaera sp.]
MTLAFLFIECIKDQAETVQKLAKQVHGVTEAHSTTGGFDLVVKVQTEDEHKLKHVVRAIKAIAGIAAVVTSIAYGNIS